MYLLDTNVISEARKGRTANPGVLGFLRNSPGGHAQAYLSVITIGELRRGIERLRYRGDAPQAKLLESWLERMMSEFGEHVLAFDVDCAQMWGRLRVPNEQHALDKQIAATALIYDLTVVTRNVADFDGCGVRLLNPFH